MKVTTRVADGLPEVCWVPHVGKKRAVLVRRGFSGYSLTDHLIPIGAVVMLNELMGVSEAQRKAMMAGSMHGWENNPEADPRHWESADAS